MDRQRSDRPAADPVFTGLLRKVINRQNTDQEVDAAAAAVDEYVEQHPAAARELARISNTVVNSGKLQNYGTVRAQEILRAWAEKYKYDK